jgi:glucose/mannose-6-phosphate isomerase
MNILDDLKKIDELDPSGMYDAIVGFPNQIRDAIKIWEITKIDPKAFPDIENIENIVICGMGGSAIGGDLAGAVLQDQIDVPIEVCRNYNLPAYAGDKTLVIGSSYSGNTEETLSAIGQAINNKCKLLIITTGGRLGEIAGVNGLPILSPRKGLQPRAALGYSFILIMAFLNYLGKAKYDAHDFLSLADFLEKRITAISRENPVNANMAKQLANLLVGRIPIIYSGPGSTNVAATRFKGQIAENAKSLAYCGQFPEQNHNELVGWEKESDIWPKLVVIFLRDQKENQRISARMDIVEEILAEKDIEMVEIGSVGEDRLQRLFSFIQVADFTSFYLAILNGVDPTPVKPIDLLKKKLGEIK